MWGFIRISNGCQKHELILILEQWHPSKSSQNLYSISTTFNNKYFTMTHMYFLSPNSQGYFFFPLTSMYLLVKVNKHFRHSNTLIFYFLSQHLETRNISTSSFAGKPTQRKISSMSWFSGETFFFHFFLFSLFIFSTQILISVCGGFVLPLRFSNMWWYILSLISRDLWWFVIVSLPKFTNLGLFILFCLVLCFMMLIFDKKSFYYMESVAKAELMDAFKRLNKSRQKFCKKEII